MDKLSYYLNNRHPLFYTLEGHMNSAVLLPLVDLNGAWQVLFEVRAHHLKRQPGEICFPGGRVEPEELNRPQDAAIRETSEEICIDQTQIQMIGPLDYFISPVGALIFPFVGQLTIDRLPTPNPQEVAEVFLVPLDFFLTVEPEQSSYEIGTRFAADFPFHRLPNRYKAGWRVLGAAPVYFYQYDDKLIWGATAGIMHRFIDIYREIM